MGWLSILVAAISYVLLRSLKHDNFLSTKEELFDAATFISLAIGLSYVLEVGPSAQHYIFAAISSDETNLYATAFQDKLVSYPSYSAWLTQNIPWEIVLISVVTIASTRLSKDSREVILFGSISCFLSLSIWDGINEYATNSLGVQSATENIIANASGAAVASGMLLLVYRLIDLLLASTTVKWIPAAAVAVIAPTLLGITFYTATYYLLSLIYAPTPAEIDAVIAPPISGYYKVSENDSKSPPSKQKKDPAFGIFSDNTTIQTPLTLYQMTNPLTMAWGGKERKTGAKIAVRIFVDCTEDQIKNAANAPSSTILFDHVNNFTMRTDAGIAEFSSDTTKEKNAIFYMRPTSSFQQFDISEGEKIGRLKVYLYQTERPPIHYWTPYGPISYVVTIPLLQPIRNRAIARRTRDLSLNIDNVVYRIRLQPTKQNNPAQKLQCQSIEINRLNHNNTIVDGAGSLAGILVHIEPQISDAEYDSQEHDSLIIERGDGSTFVDGVDREDVARTMVGGHRRSTGILQDSERVHVRWPKYSSHILSILYARQGTFGLSWRLRHNQRPWYGKSLISRPRTIKSDAMGKNGLDNTFFLIGTCFFTGVYLRKFGIPHIEIE